MGIGDGYSEARVRLLEVGGESELDVVECGVSVNDVELRWDIICTLSEDLHGGWRLRGCETRSAGLHDPTLVPCDFPNGVSQHGRVVDSQASDARHCRFDQDVRAVVFTANAAFDYRGVDVFAHVRVVCHEGQEPEVGGFSSKICRLALGSRSIL